MKLSDNLGYFERIYNYELEPGRGRKSLYDLIYNT